MAEAFPGSLQDKFNAAGFGHSFGSTTVRSDTSVGPAKVRRRWTKGIDPYNGTINLSFDDWQTLYDFYNTTLDGGSKRFTFTDPFLQTNEEFRFVSPPSMRPIGTGGREFLVTINLEKLP